MDPETARSLAHRIHLDRRTRSGCRFTEHVARVAEAVPPEARSVALLHDVLEQSPAAMAQLVDHGLTPLEAEALGLLTHDPAESYECHVLRVAYTAGPAGALARVVKVADLDDHLAEGLYGTDLPPYAWARRHVTFAQQHRDGAPLHSGSEPRSEVARPLTG
jgi:hypothetical protein